MTRRYGRLQLPRTGCLLGADDSRGFTNAAGTGVENQLQRRLAIHNRHYGWNHGQPQWPTQAEADDLARGVVPMISWMGAGGFPSVTPAPNGSDTSTVNGRQGLGRIAGGEFDTPIRAAFRKLAALPGPVIFRPWMEMNGAHNPYYAEWQGGVGGPGEAAFRAALRHLHDLAALERATLSTGGNMITVFCPQTWTSGGAWQDYYPGPGGGINWMGIDLYRSTFAESAANAAADRDFYGFGVQHGKPFIVCENGYEQDAIVHTAAGSFDKDGSKTGRPLISHVFDEIRTTYPAVVGFVLWNAVGPMGNDLIDTSPRSLDLYRAAAADPYFASMGTFV